MSRKAWLRMVLIVVSAVALVAGAAHSRQRYHATVLVSGAAGGQSALVLTGILGPNVTTPIDVPGLELEVPLNSYVLKGQVIGGTDSALGPQQVQGDESRFSPEDANVAVDAATEGVSNAEADFEAAHNREIDASIQRVLAGTAERTTESRFQNANLQFREGELSVARYYRSLNRLVSAGAAADTARTREGEAASAINDVESELKQARNKLAEAERSRRRAYVSAERRRGGSQVEVVSPADGYVVLRDPATGVYGIGSNDTALRVVTQVPADDLFRLRTGQDALISVDTLPEVTLKATIREISEVPVESATGPLYTVTFAVANPQRLSFVGEPVHIQVADAAE